MRYLFNLAREKERVKSRKWVLILLLAVIVIDLFIAYRYFFLLQKLEKIEEEIRKVSKSRSGVSASPESVKIKKKNLEFAMEASRFINTACWNWKTFIYNLERARGEKIQFESIALRASSKESEIIKSGLLEGVAADMDELLFFARRLQEMPKVKNVVIKESSRLKDTGSAGEQFIKFSLTFEVMR